MAAFFIQGYIAHKDILGEGLHHDPDKEGNRGRNGLCGIHCEYHWWACTDVKLYCLNPDEFYALYDRLNTKEYAKENRFFKSKKTTTAAYPK